MVLGLKDKCRNYLGFYWVGIVVDSPKISMGIYCHQNAREHLNQVDQLLIFFTEKIPPSHLTGVISIFPKL